MLLTGGWAIGRDAGQPRALALMALLVTLNLAASVDRTIFAALAPTIQASLHLSNPQLGLIQGPAFALPYAAALPFAGLLADRTRPRGLLIVSLATWSLGILLCAGTRTTTMLVAGRAVCGLGQAALAPVALGVIAAGVPAARVGRGIAVFTATGTLGRSVAFGVGGLLLAWSTAWLGRQDWSAMLIVLVAATVVPLTLALALVRMPATIGDGAKPAAAGLPALWRFVRASPAATASAVAVALGPVVIVQSFSGWAVPVLTQARHLTAARASGAMSLVSLAAPLGHLAGGWAMDRLSGPRAGTLVQAALVLLCIPAAIAFVGASTLAAALAGATVLMLLQGAGAVMGLARVQRLPPAAIRGSAVGLFLMLVNVVGVGGGPYAVGLATGGGEVGPALLAVILAAATIATIGALIGVSKHGS